MTDRDSDAKRRNLGQVLKVLGVVALVGIVVWRIPLGSDEAPPTPTTGEPASPATTRATPEASRFSAGELEDEIPMPDGFTAFAGTWDGTYFWVLAEGGGEGTTAVALDPETGEARWQVALPTAADIVAADADAVWTALGGGGELTRIDPTTGEIIDSTTLPEGAEVAEIAALAGSVWVRSTGGQVIRISATGDVDVVAELEGDRNGSLVVEMGEVWVMPTEGGITATRIDPFDLEAADISLSAVIHERTVGAFTDGEFFVAGAFELGSMISLVDVETLEVIDSQQLSGIVEYLGWVAGSFGVVDPEGRLVRLRPISIDGERLRTSWNGETAIFPVERELWSVSGDGSSVYRIVITGIAD